MLLEYISQGPTSSTFLLEGASLGGFTYLYPGSEKDSGQGATMQSSSAIIPNVPLNLNAI